MTADDAPKTLDELIKPGTTMMVGTPDAAGDWEFRPLTVARLDDDRIDVLLDTAEEWVTQFRSGTPVHATVSDNRTNTWLDLRATASVSRNPALIDELWNPAAGAYFEQGKETPGIGVLVVDVTEGRYWSAPSGRLGALLSMVKAKLGQPEKDSGEHGDVATG